MCLYGTQESRMKLNPELVFVKVLDEISNILGILQLIFSKI